MAFGVCGRRPMPGTMAHYDNHQVSPEQLKKEIEGHQAAVNHERVRQMSITKALTEGWDTLPSGKKVSTQSLLAQYDEARASQQAHEQAISYKRQQLHPTPAHVPDTKPAYKDPVHEITYM